jgi:hypothetical protein
MPVYRVYRAPSPYNAVEMAEVDFEQTADVLYLAHDNHQPGKFIRSGHASWAWAAVAFGPTITAPVSIQCVATKPNRDQDNDGNAWFPQDATYVVTAYNEEIGQESRASAGVTVNNDLGLKRNYNSLSWSAVTGATGYRIYKRENTQIFGYIGTTEQLTFRDDNIGPDLSEGPPIGDNPFAAPGDYPATITFHEQRSYWARTRNRPNAVYGSRSADYENMDFTRPGRADDAFLIGLVANRVNSVDQLHSFKQGLLAMTSNNLFSIQGSNEDYITATPPPRVRPESRRGSSRLRPIGIDSVVFYETAKGGEVRALGYEYEADGIKSNDMTVFSRHLFENHDIVAWDYLEKPLSCLLAVRDDGVLLSMAWDEAQEVWGWTTWETDGLYKDVCVVYENGEDRAYFLIEREIDGDTRLYVERLASDLWLPQGQSYACYIDCARTFQNEISTATFDRLDHLEGKTVVAWVDGAKVATAPGGAALVVTNGSVTLSQGGLIVTIGLPFTAQIETLPLAVQTRQGWNVAMPQDVTNAAIRIVNSRNIKAGVREDELFDLKQRDPSDSYDNISLFTGDMAVDLEGVSGNEAKLFIRSDDPTPMHISAVMIDPSIGDVA